MVKEINMTVKAREGDSGELVSLDWVARRWCVSRTTAQRILEGAQARPVFLSGAQRGVRRYRRADVIEVELQARAK